MSISSSQGIKPLCLMAPNNDPPDREYLISFSLYINDLEFQI